MEYVHAIINVFAGGRSEIKIYLFFLYLISILIISAFILRKKNDAHNSVHAVRSKAEVSTYVAFITSTILLFIIGFVLHVFFLHQIDVRLSDISVFFNNNEISSSSIFHNHFMKGSMASFYAYFSNGVIEGADIGTAFIGLYPKIIYVLSFFLLVTATVSSLFLFKNQIQKKKVTAMGDIFLYSLTYTIFAFSILKNTIDGGVLNTEAIPAIIGMYLLLSNPKTKTNKIIFLGITSFTAVILFFQNVLVILNKTIISVISIPHLLGALSLVILLIYIHFSRSNEETLLKKSSYTKSKYFLILILTICASGFYYSTQDSLDVISYKDTNISAGDEVLVFSRRNISKDISETDLKEVYRIGDMRFYRGNIKSDTTIESLVEKTGAPLNFQPVSIIGQTCEIYTRPKKLYFSLLDLSSNTRFDMQSFKNSKNEFFTIDSIWVASNTKNTAFNEYYVSTSVNPCVGREVEIIQQLFIEHGITSFVVFNIHFN